MTGEKLIDEVYRLEAEQRKLWHELQEKLTEAEYDKVCDEFATNNMLI